MEVILIKPVRKLGTVGQALSVANGYGRNYLIPQKLAIRATPENLEKFNDKKKDFEKENAESKKQAELIAKDLNGKQLKLVAHSSADGKLFGSINTKTLVSELAKTYDIKVNNADILLANPIKYNGVYNLEIALHPEVFAKILVAIGKSNSEVELALSAHFEALAKAEQKKAKAAAPVIDESSSTKPTTEETQDS